MTSKTNVASVQCTRNSNGEPQGIEITEQMTEAGVEALAIFESSSLECQAREVFVAMLTAYLECEPGRTC